MNVTLIPSKTLNKKRIQLDSLVEFYCPSLADVLAHLQKDGSLAEIPPEQQDESQQQFVADTGLPVLEDEYSSWLMYSIYSRARTKANGAFNVKGSTPETLEVEVTGELPQSWDDLVAEGRASGTYQKQKGVFLESFVAWAEKHVTKNKGKICEALAKSSLKGTTKKAFPLILGAVDRFAAELSDENQQSMRVYLRSIRKQLQAEDDADEWDGLPG